MIDPNHRPTKLTVDLSAVVHNARELKKWTGAKNLIAVVKANAYGMGAVRVAKKLEDIASKFAVATIDEALELREAGIKLPIWVFGAQDHKSLNVFVENNLEITVGHLLWLKELPEFNGSLKVQLAVDTGMQRIGFTSADDLREAVEIIAAHDQLELAGIYTHFATADEKDGQLFIDQVNRWHELTDSLNVDDSLKSVANSAASVWHKDEDLPFTNIRPGVALYGINPSDEKVALPEGLDLRPSAKLTSEVVDVRFVKANTPISYGGTESLEKDGYVATIPIGYYDGWRRSMQGSSVFINGKKFSTIGRVTMDAVLVHVNDQVSVGDYVELFGENVSLYEQARFAKTISYEVLTDLKTRIYRDYIE